MEGQFFFPLGWVINRIHTESQDHEKEKGVGRYVEIKFHQAMTQERYRADKTTEGYTRHKRVSPFFPFF
jgi:hypothetical protein